MKGAIFREDCKIWKNIQNKLTIHAASWKISSCWKCVTIFAPHPLSWVTKGRWHEPMRRNFRQHPSGNCEPWGRPRIPPYVFRKVMFPTTLKRDMRYVSSMGFHKWRRREEAVAVWPSKTRKKTRRRDFSWWQPTGLANVGKGVSLVLYSCTVN